MRFMIAIRCVRYSDYRVKCVSLTFALVLMLAVLSICVNRSSAAGGDGDIDPTFKSGGTEPGGMVDGVAVQPDGKIIIVGGYFGDDAERPFSILRLSVNGALDPSFNASGPGASHAVYTVALQPDGKIIIGGNFTGYIGDPTAPDGIMRLNADGTRDTAFNPGGTGTDGVINTIAVLPDGKILVGGTLGSYNGNSAASDRLMRLLCSWNTLDT
jgi:uncharacterized delta-60 repeat protein